MRNPFVGIDKEPLTREAVQHLRNELSKFWEDTMLVTKPNGYSITLVGNLKALCDHLLTDTPLAVKSGDETTQQLRL